MNRQEQPFFIITVQHSPQAWIISQHWTSPLVQVMHTPESVISQRQMPMMKLTWHTCMPFIIMLYEHIPPITMEHKCWTILAAVLSLKVQWILTPPVHFSIFMEQQGTMTILLGMEGVEAGVGATREPTLGTVVVVRSIITVARIGNSFHLARNQCGSLPERAGGRPELPLPGIT